MTLPQTKVVYPVNFVSATNAGTVICQPIDTIGYDWATIDIAATTQLASTQAGSPSVLKLQEADNTSATSFVDVVGFRGGSATATNVDFVVGIGTTGTTPANAYKFNVDLRARKRYLSLVISPTTTQTFVVDVNLGRGENAPVSATKAGVLNLVEG